MKQMKQKLACALLLALLLPLIAGFAVAAEGARVFDNAKLLSSDEREALESEIAQFQEDTGIDFVLLTSDTSHGNASVRDIAAEFYDRGGFGLDDENSGDIYYIDMFEREFYLVNTGKMIDIMNDERVEAANEACTPYLSSGDYVGAASNMLSILRTNINEGIPEGQNRYDVITGERLTARHKALTTMEMLVCLAIGVVGGLIVVLTVKSRYKLKGKTYHYDYRQNSTVAVTDSEDTYLRTTTTQTRKADPPSGGGASGSGGGSGVFSGSSGTSHSGGGGKF